MYQRLTILLLFTLLGSCSKDNGQQQQLNFSKPVVSGDMITFSSDTIASYFSSKAVERLALQAEFAAPSRVVATVMRSTENPSLNMVLFDNPELTMDYTQLLQHLANIKQIETVTIRQREIELDRVMDLQKHGAATGRDVLDAQTALAMARTDLINEKSSLIQEESMLKLGGFSTEALRTAKQNTVWVISEIAENQISKLRPGETCQVTFASFPDEVFAGKVEDVGDVVDNITRLLKVRIGIMNPDKRLKAGMFGNVRFGLREGNFLAVPLDALVTVQGKNYVFVKKSPREFERRLVLIGQQLGDRAILVDGASEKEQVVVKGTMQLKGLAFGY